MAFINRDGRTACQDRSPDAELIAEGITRAEGASWDAAVESMRNDVQCAIWPAIHSKAA
ncbi:MAG: hypothetical protein LH610_08035 [Sphingomonas bacterium]|nr:hypothetical protein [Sphingomonas bacterium]